MKQEEVDAILQVMENPVRRRIIKLLSQEPCYALQLSKELGLGQPLVAKHLAVMEDAGLVTSTSERSPSGPPRKRYSLARSISLTMDVAPNLFIERAVAFEAGGQRKKASERPGLLAKRVDSAVEVRDDREKLSLLSEVLSDVDGRIGDVENERVELLRIRDRAMREAARVANNLEGFDSRRVLFHILDEHDTEVESISEALNLREFVVKSILKELERDYLG
jgi:predicted transcriptional regulator